jgi:hypothetical protein
MKFKLLLSILSFIPTLVFAQTAPNLVGTWKGISHSAVMGTGRGHNLLKKDSEIYFNRVPFVLVIDRQEGFNFSGLFSSESHKEVVLGAISPDLQSGIWVDEDGAVNFKIVNPNTIHVCYAQLNKPKIAACTEYKKQ